MKLSLIIGPYWLRFRYPDTGVWRWGTREWVNKGQTVRHTWWRRWV